MLNNMKFTEFLNLFKLKHYEQNGEVFVYNPEAKSFTRLDENNCYKITINGKAYYLNKKFIILDMNDFELVINSNEISFLKRNPNNYSTTKTFNLNNNAISFYGYNDYSSYGLTLYYDNDYKIYKLRKAEEFTDETGITKTVFNFQDENSKYVIRKYDFKRNLIAGYSFNEASTMSIQEYIDNHIKNYSIIRDIIDEMEKIIPGITNYYGDLNPIMTYIINSLEESKNKKYQK